MLASHKIDGVRGEAKTFASQTFSIFFSVVNLKFIIEFHHYYRGGFEHEIVIINPSYYMDYTYDRLTMN